MGSEKGNAISVQGIVALRNHMPYVQILQGDGILCQFSMSEARQIASDIINMAARTEADAMIFRFFHKADFPENAAGALMAEFRNFRKKLDDEAVEHRHDQPNIIIPIN